MRCLSVLRVLGIAWVAGLLTALTAAQTPLPVGGTPKPFFETGTKPDEKLTVRIYLEDNLRGRVLRVPVPCELIDAVALQKYGIPNDSIRSMIIPSGVTVTLYDNYGYGGRSQSFTGTVPNLGDMRSITSALKAVLQVKP